MERFPAHCAFRQSFVPKSQRKQQQQRMCQTKDSWVCSPGVWIQDTPSQDWFEVHLKHPFGLPSNLIFWVDKTQLHKVFYNFMVPRKGIFGLRDCRCPSLNLLIVGWTLNGGYFWGRNASFLERLREHFFTGCFQGVTGKSHGESLSHGSWIKWCFEVPSSLGCSMILWENASKKIRNSVLGAFLMFLQINAGLGNIKGVCS